MGSVLLESAGQDDVKRCGRKGAGWAQKAFPCWFSSGAAKWKPTAPRTPLYSNSSWRGHLWGRLCCDCVRLWRLKCLCDLGLNGHITILHWQRVREQKCCVTPGNCYTAKLPMVVTWSSVTAELSSICAAPIWLKGELHQFGRDNNPVRSCWLGSGAVLNKVNLCKQLYKSCVCSFPYSKQIKPTVNAAVLQCK